MILLSFNPREWETRLLVSNRLQKHTKSIKNSFRIRWYVQKQLHMISDGPKTYPFKKLVFLADIILDRCWSIGLNPWVNYCIVLWGYLRDPDQCKRGEAEETDFKSYWKEVKESAPGNLQLSCWKPNGSSFLLCFWMRNNMTFSVSKVDWKWTLFSFFSKQWHFFL